MRLALHTTVSGSGPYGDVSGWKVNFKLGTRYIGTFGPYRVARKSEAIYRARIAAEAKIRSVRLRIVLGKSSKRSANKRNCSAKD
jgi:hypothetical protein